MIEANTLVAIAEDKDWQQMVDSLGLDRAIEEGLSLKTEVLPLAGLTIVTDSANGVAAN